MRIDWEKYRAECAKKRKRVLIRFRDMLLKGAAVSTVQSAPVCTGALTAALVTVLKQMTDLLCQYAGSAENSCNEETPVRMPGTGCGTVPADRERIRCAVRKSYFVRLSGIRNLKIAEEYVNTHFRYRETSEEDMTAWLLSFQGQPDAASELAHRIDEETDAFIREEIPKILRAYRKDAQPSRRRHL